jgi:general secretion pathway protein G
MKNSGTYLMLMAMIALMCFFISNPRHPRSSYAPKAHAFAYVNGSLKIILQMFKEDCGRFPTTEEGFKVLIQQPTNDLAKGWRGPYFDPPKVPKDPWGHEYVYRCPGIYSTNGYDLYSLGPDGVSKTGGHDPDDIANWYKIFPPQGQ